MAFAPKAGVLHPSFPPPSPSPNFLFNFSSVFLSPSDSCSHITTLSLSLFFLMWPNVMECQPVVLELLVSDVNKIEISIQKTTMKSCVHAKLLQSCPNLCSPMDHSLPGSSVHGIIQERILEWVAILTSRGSF